MSPVPQRRQKLCASGIVDQRPGRMIMWQLKLSVAPRGQLSGSVSWRNCQSHHICEGARVVISNLPDQGRDLG